MAVKKSNIITVFSTKGGVGKTTLVLALSGILSKLNKKVLILDFDFSSGGIALSLKLDPKKTIFNLIDDLTNKRLKNVDDYILKYNDNIDVISTCIDPRQSNKINSKHIDMVLSMFNKYDYILIDTNHIINDNNIMILDKSSYILLNITNDIIDIKNARNLISVFDDINKTNYKVILNNSVNVNKDFLTLFDIKNIIKRNVDYTISKSFNIKNLDKYILDGEIITLNNKINKKHRKEIDKLKNLIKDIEKEVNYE